MRKFRKYKKFSRPKRTTNAPVYEDFNNGKKNQPVSKDDKLDLGIANITLKQLPKSTYAIKTSPYDEANEAGTPYPFVTSYNGKVSASYAGYENLDGGKTSQYLSSNQSRLLHACDSMSFKVGVNYRFLNLDPSRETVNVRGTRILRLMYDAIVEAMAQLDATTFMELELVKTYYVISSIKIQGVDPAKELRYKNSAGGIVSRYVYTDPAAVILFASIEYQIMNQQTIANFNTYNKFMSYNKKMLQMNYMREIPVLNDLFGQLKKVGFVTKLDSLSLSLQGEWIDVDWAQQNNITANQVSRRSDAIIDPVLELLSTYNFIPELYILSGTSGTKDISSLHAYNVEPFNYPAAPATSTEYVYTTYNDYVGAINNLPAIKIWTPSSREVTVKVSAGDSAADFATLNYEQLSDRINKFFSITDTLQWARSSRNLSSQAVNRSSSARFNLITWTVDCLQTVVTRIKTQFGDLRTIFEKLSPLGLINYTKGIKLVRTNVYDTDFKHYLTVEDICKTIFTGVNTMTFNNEVGRWQSVALWDKTFGIPLFDAKNGGSFLTFCAKGLAPLNVAELETANVDLIPCIFTYGKGTADGITMVNRLGDTIGIDVKTSQSLDNSTKRLAILPSQDSYLLHFPYVVKFNDYDSDLSSHIDDVDQAFIELAMINTLGSYYTVDGRSEYSHDIIAFYEYQMVDISQPMLSYSKAYGPIKGTNEKPGFIGFAGLTGTARRE